jgi:hypothetical protein
MLFDLPNFQLLNQVKYAYACKYAMRAKNKNNKGKETKRVSRKGRGKDKS